LPEILSSSIRKSRRIFVILDCPANVNFSLYVIFMLHSCYDFVIIFR
jgi:hypothetical protein